MTIPKELQELRANVETLTQKYKEVKAQDPNCPLGELEDLLFRLISGVHNRISYLEDGFYDWAYDHQSNGHLPKILGAGKMEKALDKLGLSDDYDVRKPVVYASISNGKGLTAEIRQ